jgi:NADH-quinone oxidoreductase subunit E
MVISEQTRAQIEQAAARYPRRRGALLPALHLVQRELGCIAPDTATEVAEIFGIHPIEVMELVTFYNMFHDRPKGRHQVRVCTNLPCSLRGARSMLGQLEAYLGVEAGETTSDGRITLGHEECLGACAWAPMMRVGDTYHENLDVEQAKRILDALE